MMRSELAFLLVLALLTLGSEGCSQPGPNAKKMTLDEFTTWQQIASFAAVGGDVNKAGTDGTTPLQNAAHKRHFQVAQLLLEKGADDNSTTGWVTPLHIAVANRDLEMTEFLISHHADVTGQAVVDLVSKYEASVRAAARKEMEPMVGTNARIDITMPWQQVSRMPPLWTALEWNRADLARLLLKGGAKLKSGGLTREQPLLHEAIANNRPECARLLIEYGAEVNERTLSTFLVPAGVAPLHLAAGRANLELVDFLLNHGADLNGKDQEGRTPLTYALRGVPSGIIEEHEVAIVTTKDGTPPAPKKVEIPEPDAAHKAVADFLRSRGAKE